MMTGIIQAENSFRYNAKLMKEAADAAFVPESDYKP